MMLATAVCMLIVGVGIGILLGFLWCDRKSRSAMQELRAAIATAEQRCTDFTARLQSESERTETLRKQVAESDRSAATLSAQLQGAQQNIHEQRQLLDQANAKLREAFASVSAEALAKNNEAFLQLAKERFAQLNAEATGSLEQRKTQIEGLLKPLQEILGQYQSRLGDIEKSRVESYSMLREQLGILSETQRTLNQQTSQLVSALRRPTARGQWGEITLKRLVELAGMSSHCDFCEQASVENEDGRQRPDMLIHLPGEREIVIDCKAALDGFLDAAAAADDDNRKVHLQRHCQQVRAGRAS
jgi:DNA recombination protein RmuC